MDKHRLADVRCDGTGRRKSGSGYLIAPQLVLTARHVIVDETGKVWPRITAGVGHPPSGGVERRAATVCWTDPDGADAALLHLDAPVDVPGTVRWGRPVGTEALPYSGLGYPLQTRAEGGQRLVEHLRGVLSPLAGGEGPHDLYTLDQHAAPRLRTDQRRAWSGISGAAVFCQGCLIGIVLHDDEEHENRRLRALPARRFATGSAFVDLLQKNGAPAPELMPAEGQPAIPHSGRQLEARGFTAEHSESHAEELVAMADSCTQPPEPTSSDVANRIAQLRDKLELGVMAVIGTGLSLSTPYPTSAGLTALLWDAIDADPEARALLAAELGQPDQPAKLLIGDDFARSNLAWRTVDNHILARRRFQQEMANLDLRRSAQPSTAHEELAALIHAGVIECVVSLNWDTSLESAYRRQYGTEIPSGILFKPHGDAARPEQPWVLPHLPGTLSPELDARIQHLVAHHPRTLLLVGYSERDRHMVEQLIAPLGHGWLICRIGPEASGIDDIPSTVDTALTVLARNVREREAMSAWHTVTFTGKGDIGRALAGARLGPRDVDACPRLFEVDLLADALRRDHAVVLNGDSGCGKSITAYQATSDLLKDDGYEVLRLRDDARKRDPRQWAADLALYAHRKVLLIDDAQDLSADLVRELAETATTDQLILIVGVDHVAGGVSTYRISGAAAVGTLAHEMRKRADEILPAVRRLDDSVGEQIGDERLLDRLTEAGQAESAWRFFYTLTGGWRRTERDVLDLRGHDRADLLLLALAIAQVASVDAGVTARDLESYAHALGRDRAWIDRGLRILQDKRLTIVSDGILRCAHLRAAWALITWMLHLPQIPLPPQTRVVIPPIASAVAPAPPTPVPAARRSRRVRAALPESQIEADREAAAALLCLALDAPGTPMRGAAWLIGRNHSSEARWVLARHGVLTRSRIRALAERALSTPAGADAGMAAHLLERLLLLDESVCLDLVRNRCGKIREWLVDVSPENGWAIGGLINSLSYHDREFTEELLVDVDPHALARLIPEGGWPHIYSTTHAVERITQGGGLRLMERVGDAYDPNSFQVLVDHPPASIEGISELLKTLAYTARELGLSIFERLIPYLAAQVSKNPPVESQKIFDTWTFLLGFAPRFLRGRRAPDRAARRLAKKFVRSLDLEQLAQSLSRPRADLTWHNFHYFVSFVWEADPAIGKAVVGRMDLETLAAEFERSLPSPPQHHLYAVEVLHEFRPAEARELLERYEAQYATIDPFLAHMAPEMTIRLLRCGLPLDLGLPSQHWEFAAELLNSLASYDTQVAAELAAANCSGFVAGLSSNYTDPFEGLSAWVQACDTYAPGLVDDVIRLLPSGAVATWARALRKGNRRREIAPLLYRALETDGAVVAEAQELMRQFPSLKQP
ncbi:trypsin-like peptidase domain-containing protein [Streptomyces viridosporus]